MPDSDRSSPDQRPRLDGSPSRRRMSNDPEAIAPREHSFVRTTFSKPVICRVCNQSVKKSAVLCEQCSLISHVKCSQNAPPTCDLRTQLLLYAQYAETNNPMGQYGDPLELLDALQTNGPVSLTSDGDVTPRNSIDSTNPQSSPVSGSPHPPSAYKVLQAFKRSKSFLTDHQDRGSPVSLTPPAPPPPVPSGHDHQRISRKRSVLKRRSDTKERPLSLSSNSTTPNSSSLRSAVTAAESLSSSTRRSTRSDATETGGRDQSDSRFSQLTNYSIVSAAGTDREESGPSTHSKDLPRSSRSKQRDSKSSNSGCSVQ